MLAGGAFSHSRLRGRVGKNSPTKGILMGNDHQSLDIVILRCEVSITDEPVTTLTHGFFGTLTVTPGTHTTVSKCGIHSGLSASR